jgi:hypothetical protein
MPLCCIVFIKDIRLLLFTSPCRWPRRCGGVPASRRSAADASAAAHNPVEPFVTPCRPIFSDEWCNWVFAAWAISDVCCAESCLAVHKKNDWKYAARTVINKTQAVRSGQPGWGGQLA